jgi:molybdenum cofactor guanylyltransferase
MSLPYALVYAGGRGERLGGVDKARLRLGGTTLLAHVLAALGAVQTPVLLATGPRSPSTPLPAHCHPLLDPPDVAGPLAGLLAAADHFHNHAISAGTLITAAVDTPFLPADYTARLLAALDHHPAAFAAWGPNFYPTHAAFRLSALPPPDTAHRSIRTLLDALGAARVDWQPDHPTDPFGNVNTVSDLLALRRAHPA